MIDKLAVLQVVEQSSRSAYQQVHPFFKFYCLAFAVHSTYQQANCFIMVFAQLTGHLEHLHRQLSSRRHDYNSSPLLLPELKSIKQLEAWYEVGKGFT